MKVKMQLIKKSSKTSTNVDQPRKTKKKSGISRIYHRGFSCRKHTKQDANQNSSYSNEDDIESIYKSCDEHEECDVHDNEDSECDVPVENSIPEGSIGADSFSSARSELSCSPEKRLRSADSPQSPTILQSVVSTPEILKRDKLSERKGLSLKENPIIEESLEFVRLHRSEQVIRDSRINEGNYDLNKKDSSEEGEQLCLTSCDNFNCLNLDIEDENCGSCVGNDPVVGNKGFTPLEPDKRVCCQSCIDCKSQVPSLFPSQWPQSPLLLRPTPGSGTRVKGVRFADSSNYLKSTDLDGEKDKIWNSLKPCPDLTMNLEGTRIIQPTEFCPECCDIPINSGKEAEGRSVVVDFESLLFMGTMQVRVRGSFETIKKDNNPADYFKGVNRHYHVIIRGCFKKEGIPMIECVSGQVFNGPLKLPSSYISKGLVKVLKYLSPRLQAKLDGDKPHLLSPLGSTPQTVNVGPIIDGVEDYKADVTISKEHEEPSKASRQLIPILAKSTSTSSAKRSKDRKKAFDKLCTLGNKSVTFQKDKEYTFEFLQHLFNPEKFELSLGSILGNYKVDAYLKGQCLNIMAAHQRLPVEGEIDLNHKLVNDSILDTLWSFDLWHENLLDTGSHK